MDRTTFTVMMATIPFILFMIASIIIVMKVSDSRAITKAVFITINIILIILTILSVRQPKMKRLRSLLSEV